MTGPRVRRRQSDQRRWLSVNCTREAVPPACGDGNRDPGMSVMMAIGSMVMAARRIAPRSSSACGDGNRDPGEECDDSNAMIEVAAQRTVPVRSHHLRVVTATQAKSATMAPIDGDGCSANCTREVAPPAVGWPPDQGEEAMTVTRSMGMAAQPIARANSPPVCGDGNLDDDEECDDGNRFDGDGCSRHPRRESRSR